MHDTLKWAVWFTADNGLPRVKYLTLTDNAEIRLSHIRFVDKFEATVSVKVGDFDIQKTATLAEDRDNTIGNWSELEPKAIEWARDVLTTVQTQVSEALSKI